MKLKSFLKSLVELLFQSKNYKRRVQAAIFGITLLLGTVALAHSKLVQSTPKEGEILHIAPTKVELTFSAPIEQSVSSFEVVGKNTKEKLISSTEFSRNEHITLSLPKLDPGEYKVVWSVLSIDGHRQKGALTFSFQPSS